MNEIGEVPAGAKAGVAGWYPDPWSRTLLRWWTGQSWTFTTTEAAGPQPPPPAQPAPMPPAAAPPPSPPPPPPPKPPAPPTAKPERAPGTLSGGRLIALLVVVGLIAGLVGVRLLRRPDRPSTGNSSEVAGGLPTTTTPATDPSASVLPSLVVRAPDVTAPAAVTLLAGGSGLSRPTLDLCNGRYPSESHRTARLQDGMLDGQGDLTLSTEAVLYDNPASAVQALNELRSVSAACPATAVQSPVGDPAAITHFNPPPDGDWPATPTVNRLAYDFTSTDPSTGQTTHSIAVYLQRGRALVGVYFFAPDGPQTAVAGQTTIPGIVGVFAGRLAALPASVVSA